jgi:hypothetical protein
VITRELFFNTVTAVCDITGANDEQRSHIVAAVLVLAAAGGFTTDGSAAVIGLELRDASGN